MAKKRKPKKKSFSVIGFFLEIIIGAIVGTIVVVGFIAMIATGIAVAAVVALFAFPIWLGTSSNKKERRG